MPSPDKIFAGLHVLVTSGPTREAIDPVRYLSNHSSGKQGHAIAAAFAARGARVTLVSGPVSVAAPEGVALVRVESAREMLEACVNALPADIAVCAAAVSDWRTRAVAAHKLKKREGEDEMTMTFVRNPDILATLGRHPLRPRIVAGFAAETENLAAHTSAKLAAKNADVIFANDVSGGAVFGDDATHLHAVTRAGAVDWGRLDKSAAAERIATLIADLLD